MIRDSTSDITWKPFCIACVTLNMFACITGITSILVNNTQWFFYFTFLISMPISSFCSINFSTVTYSDSHFHIFNVCKVLFQSCHMCRDIGIRDHHRIHQSLLLRQIICFAIFIWWWLRPLFGTFYSFPNSFLMIFHLAVTTFICVFSGVFIGSWF